MVADHPFAGQSLIYDLGCDTYSLSMHHSREQQGLGCKKKSHLLYKPPPEEWKGENNEHLFMKPSLAVSAKKGKSHYRSVQCSYYFTFWLFLQVIINSLSVYEKYNHFSHVRKQCCCTVLYPPLHSN